MKDTTSFVEALPSLCGCAGKTSIPNIVMPARQQMITRLSGTQVRLADVPDAALLPLTGNLERTVSPVFGTDGQNPTSPMKDCWTLVMMFANQTLGGDAARFAEVVGDAYRQLGSNSRIIIGKAHSVQVPKAASSQLWFEHLRPTGCRQPGYIAANIDAIHAFPGLVPNQQAAIAIRHALNDCYAAGASTSRTIRPIVAVPTTADVSTTQLQEWYRNGAPEGATILEGTISTHTGSGWIFGAVVTADLTHRPPVRVPTLGPGDTVLVHRPFGALTLYTDAIDSSATNTELLTSAQRSLARDHVRIAKTIAEFCPAINESFDPTRHIKLATDVSGDGILGLARLLKTPETTLHVTDFPLLDKAGIDQARRRWVVPDVTVETNGPLAIVGQPTVIQQVKEQLAKTAAANPVVLGELRRHTATTLSTADDIALGQYIEQVAQSEAA